MKKPFVPKNTGQSTKWAMSNLHEWYKDYNTRNPDVPCPEIFLSPTCSKREIDKWLCVFVTETRSKTGNSYPPKTIMSLLSGILCSMRSSNPHYPNFMLKGNPDFVELHATIDNLFKSLRSKGIGATVGHTEPISTKEENQLWASGILNVDSPQGLLRCVFYYVGKCFCLRGGQEHRDLCLKQLQRFYEPDRYVYSEHSSKNRQGGFLQSKLEHKTVTIVANSAIGERCPVFLLDKYIKKLPAKVDFFYCKPFPSVPAEPEKPWYYNIPVGRNTLSKMVQEMCAEAGISGKKTNHSLRVTGATSLFEAGVPEKLIQQRTGHRSLESLRMYERVSDNQEMVVSKILSGDKTRYDSLLSSSSACVVVSTAASSSACSSKPVIQSSNSHSMPSSIQYNNCTVNINNGPPMSMFQHYPLVPSYPFPYPAMYPPILPPSNVDVVEDDD